MKILYYSLNHPHTEYLEEPGQSVLYSYINWHSQQAFPEVEWYSLKEFGLLWQKHSLWFDVSHKQESSKKNLIVIKTGCKQDNYHLKQQIKLVQILAKAGKISPITLKRRDEKTLTMIFYRRQEALISPTLWMNMKNWKILRTWGKERKHSQVAG